MDYSPLKNHQYWLHSPVYSPLIIRNSPLITIIIHIYHDIHHISPWLSPLLPSKRPSLLGIHHHIHHYNLHMSPLWTTIYQYQPLWKPWFTVVDHFFAHDSPSKPSVPCRVGRQVLRLLQLSPTALRSLASKSTEDIASLSWPSQRAPRRFATAWKGWGVGRGGWFFRENHSKHMVNHGFHNGWYW